MNHKKHGKLYNFPVHLSFCLENCKFVQNFAAYRKFHNVSLMKGKKNSVSRRQIDQFGEAFSK